MIRLRKLEPSDLPFLYQWENDAAVWASSSTHNPLSQQDLRAYIESTTGDLYRDGQLRLIAESVGEDGAVATVGCVDLFDLDIRNRRAALGLYISPAFRGQGYAHGIMVELEQYAFSFLHLRMLYAVIAASNTPCQSAYRTLGYAPVATLPQWTLEDDAVVWQKFAPAD